MLKWISILSIFCLFFPTYIVKAQTTNSSLPIYIVQSGDTLNTIASRFNVSPIDIEKVNNITNPDEISVGQQLSIPDLPGITGILQTIVVPFGQSIESISHQYQIPVANLISLNHITSPMQLYAGSYLIIPQPESATNINVSQTIIQSGETFLEAAASTGLNPWELALSNDMNGTWNALPGEGLFYQSLGDQTSSELINPLISSVTIKPLPITQGNTVLVSLQSKSISTLEGDLSAYTLNFLLANPGQYVALQGISAMIEPGLYPLRLYGSFSDGSKFDYQQNVLVNAGYFPKDPPLTVPPETIDPTVTAPEDSQVAILVKPVTTTRYWSGPFRLPVDEPICIESGYGDRRSYNGSDYTYFHTGIDFGTCANNLNIYAPAAGVVVFTGLLTVRGNTVIIDHGWGIYSGLYHQSKILVQVGQKVEAGQLIGIIGATGRVNGPHVHWDLFVNSIQANPLDWTTNNYP